MGVGMTLKGILRDKKWTIKQLSESSGISINTLYSITRRDSERVDDVILQRIADALGVSINQLRDNEELLHLPRDDKEARLKYLRRKAITDPPPLSVRVSTMMQFMTKEGQEKVLSYTEDIYPRYRTDTPTQPTPAPPEGKDTTTPEPPSESP